MHKDCHEWYQWYLVESTALRSRVDSSTEFDCSVRRLPYCPAWHKQHAIAVVVDVGMMLLYKYLLYSVLIEGVQVLLQ